MALSVLSVMLLFSAMLLFGCVTEPPVQPPAEKPPDAARTCTNVTEQMPAIVEECGNVSFTETVCQVRKMSYVANLEPRLDLCIGDGSCVGNPLGECPTCSKAMTRCVMIIHNEEAQKAGTWTVVANFTLGNSGFNKEPITHTIKANESHAFDFHQIYTPGYPTNSASCTLAVVGEPSFEDCHEETRMRVQCNNVTKNVSVVKQVCQ